MTENKKWFVYIVNCSDNTFYTGITTDLARRVDEHNSDKLGAKYTRARQPVKLVYSQECGDRSSASSREYQIKKLSRAKKLQLLQLS